MGFTDFLGAVRSPASRGLGRTNSHHLDDVHQTVRAELRTPAAGKREAAATGNLCRYHRNGGPTTGIGRPEGLYAQPPCEACEAELLRNGRQLVSHPRMEDRTSSESLPEPVLAPAADTMDAADIRNGPTGSLDGFQRRARARGLRQTSALGLVSTPSPRSPAPIADAADAAANDNDGVEPCAAVGDRPSRASLERRGIPFGKFARDSAPRTRRVRSGRPADPGDSGDADSYNAVASDSDAERRSGSLPNDSTLVQDRRAPVLIHALAPTPDFSARPDQPVKRAHGPSDGTEKPPLATTPHSATCRRRSSEASREDDTAALALLHGTQEPSSPQAASPRRFSSLGGVSRSPSTSSASSVGERRRRRSTSVSTSSAATGVSASSQATQGARGYPHLPSMNHSAWTRTRSAPRGQSVAQEQVRVGNRAHSDAPLPNDELNRDRNYEFPRSRSGPRGLDDAAEESAAAETPTRARNGDRSSGGSSGASVPKRGLLRSPGGGARGRLWPLRSGSSFGATTAASSEVDHSATVSDRGTDRDTEGGSAARGGPSQDHGREVALHSPTGSQSARPPRTAPSDDPPLQAMDPNAPESAWGISPPLEYGTALGQSGGFTGWSALEPDASTASQEPVARKLSGSVEAPPLVGRTDAHGIRRVPRRPEALLSANAQLDSIDGTAETRSRSAPRKPAASEKGDARQDARDTSGGPKYRRRRPPPLLAPDTGIPGFQGSSDVLESARIPAAPLGPAALRPEGGPFQRAWAPRRDDAAGSSARKSPTDVPRLSSELSESARSLLEMSNRVLDGANGLPGSSDLNGAATGNRKTSPVLAPGNVTTDEHFEKVLNPGKGSKTRDPDNANNGRSDGERGSTTEWGSANKEHSANPACDEDPYELDEASQSSLLDGSVKSEVARARNGILPAENHPRAVDLAVLAEEADQGLEQHFVFGRKGQFTDGGFVITSDGLVKTPSNITQKDQRAPRSNVILVRSMDEFTRGPTLGVGAAARVYLASHERTKAWMAVKEINVYTEDKRHQLRKELETLISHDSRYLVRSYGAFYDGAGSVHVTLEYMDRGALSDAIRKSGAAAEPVIRQIARNCLQGLSYLHRNRRLHRDFKTANILLSRRAGLAKLSDFGLARDLTPGASRADTFVGTLAYMSPERLHGDEYTYASDIWGLGISLLECALGRYPFEKLQSYFDYVDAVRSNPWELVSDKVSANMLDFVQQCTRLEPAKRSTVNDLLSHDWLKEGGHIDETTSWPSHGFTGDRLAFCSWLDGLPEVGEAAADDNDVTNAADGGATATRQKLKAKAAQV